MTYTVHRNIECWGHYKISPLSKMRLIVQKNQYMRQKSIVMYGLVIPNKVFVSEFYENIMEIYLVLGIPPPSSLSLLHPINIPKQVKNEGSAHELAARYLKNSVDTTQSPCDNFYEYACNNYAGGLSFSEIDMYNLMQLIKAYNKDGRESVCFYKI